MERWLFASHKLHFGCVDESKSLGKLSRNYSSTRFQAYCSVDGTGSCKKPFRYSALTRAHLFFSVLSMERFYWAIKAIFINWIGARKNDSIWRKQRVDHEAVSESVLWSRSDKRSKGTNSATFRHYLISADMFLLFFSLLLTLKWLPVSHGIRASMRRPRSEHMSEVS